LRLTRLFVPERLAVGQQASLPEAASLHVTRVLRLAAGARVVLFDGSGGEYDGTIVQTARSGVTLLPTQYRPVERESVHQVALLQALARGEKMDWIVQKATELGVARIVSVALERSVVRLKDEQAIKRLAHWRAIAVNACEQCGRNRLPEIVLPCTLDEALQVCTDCPESLQLLLDPEATVALSASLPSAPQRVTVLIGPEGGLTSAETDTAIGAGFVGVNLGPRVLRTETAALAVLSVLQFAPMNWQPASP